MSGRIGVEESGRRAERLSVGAAARLRPNSWSSVEATVVDLSREGFRAECDARLRTGSAVSLEIPGVGPVEAQVEWQRGGEFGARFFQPIDLSACTWTLREQRHALATLLVGRARASALGRGGAEAQMRKQILAALPMQRTGSR
jgi:hypothetical protein